MVRMHAYLLAVTWVLVVMMCPLGAMAGQAAVPSDQALTSAQWVEWGEELYMQGRNLTAAADAFSRAIAADKHNADAYAWRGQMKQMMKDHEAALADFNQALRIKPDSGLALAMRSAAYAVQGNHAAARSDRDNALGLTPLQDPRIYNYSALASQFMGQDDFALALYDKAVALDASYAPAYINRGLLYNKMGRNEEALKNYSRAIALHPGYAAAWYNRGNLYLLTGRTSEAAADYSLILAMYREYPDALEARGLAYALEENWRLAEADFLAAISLTPQAGSPRFSLAQLYEKQGDQDKALAQYRLAHERLATIDDAQARQKISLRLGGDWSAMKEWVL